MKKHLPHINKWLLPFSWVYGFVVCLRNKFFEWGILKQVSFDLPVICVGNISAGGTGKTPHIEYLVHLLNGQYRVAVLSRGYKRKSRGFVLADEKSTSVDIGDESFQIKRKFSNILVAVDNKRKRGIENLLALDENIRPEVILLDDALQHRYVTPSFTIILSDYSRPFYQDILLPAGHLRESKDHMDSANIILITKCLEEMKPIDQRIITHEINPFPFQTLLFTKLTYAKLTPVFHGVGPNISLEKLQDKNVLLIVGIANPTNLINKIKFYTDNVEVLSFPDHHPFSKKDVKMIESRYANIEGNKLAITTEKDAARLFSREDISNELHTSLYYLPIKVSFMSSTGQEMFNEKIIQHVERNTRNC